MNTYKFEKGSAHVVIVIVIVVAVLGALGFVFWNNFIASKVDSVDVQAISSFDDCKNAPGSIIQESYPERCVTADGETFTGPSNSPVEYCTQAEKLCFDLPYGWTVEQQERDENDASPTSTDKLSVVAPDSTLYLHLTTGIDGLGGMCDPNDSVYTVVKSVPTKLTGFEEDEFSMGAARVVQLVSTNINNYTASLYLTTDKDLKDLGEHTDDCKLMFSGFINGKNSRPYPDNNDSAGALTLRASQTPYEGISSESPEFATKAEAIAIFDTEVYKQATDILASVRYEQ